MNPHIVDGNLESLHRRAATEKITGDDRIVILSDLHMGNKGERDDFKKNSNLTTYVLQHYYFNQNFRLILNGDIEELHKFRLRDILAQYQALYSVFDLFRQRDRLVKIVGNHDHHLCAEKRYPLREQLDASLKLDYEGEEIFIFHGHQASDMIEKYNALSGFALRYFARPLRIKNVSAAYNSKRKYRVEKVVHKFSRERRIISIIGHTHRPLFESLSKIDFIKYNIEQLCRKYATAPSRDKKSIELDIRDYKEELRYYRKKNKKMAVRSSPYDSLLPIPCLFNSGCAVGKRGITAIELHGGIIALVYWFGHKKRKKYLRHYDQKPARLGTSNYFRMVLNQDQLDYIFSRIKLLV